MSVDLAGAAADFLRSRRARGYRLADHDWLIANFLEFLAGHGANTITVPDALAFAQAPAGTTRHWQATRLNVIREFAAHVHALDPGAAELVPAGLIAAKTTRRIPYLYSQEQIMELMAAAAILPQPMLAASMHTLIGLLAATGLRSGEAVALDLEDLCPEPPVLTVTGKYGKERLVPIHASTLQALSDYQRLRAALTAKAPAGPLLVGTRGNRLNLNSARAAFRRVANTAKLPTRPGGPTARLHDLRHSFAVQTLIDAHRQGADVDARIAVLATYLGHVDPLNTYWYLSASPELMSVVRDRMAAFGQGGRS
ncbi:tyrosine-type recombinase/integrase [Specibacter cremeus]|uniref:tyrosine-type recombinase/integrase n=1 Tax=Specibacter cremeus TaxID=1629051 RepID=UPI000F791A6F|nr:tyrosine-type recombinase/integrase [Specibacter cremeus]